MKTRFILTLTMLLLASCGTEESSSFNDDIKNSSDSVLYVASGSCYAGGVVTSTGANTVTAFDTKTGKQLQVIVDYNQIMPGDAPVGVEEYDADSLLVLIENASGRRIDLVKKDGSSVSTFILNATALTAVGRKLRVAPDGSGYLVSKSTAIEKFSPSKARITQGANPYINAPGSTCGASATLLSDFVMLSNGKHVFVHAAATPNNKIAVIAAGGYVTTGDCLAAQAAPTTTALPTGIAYLNGRLLVSYGSVTTASNFIYSYDINETTNVISNVTNAYTNTGIVNGPSAIAADTTTNEVYVAVGNSGFNTIEKFQYDMTTRLLNRVGNSSFVSPSVNTRCIAAMKVASR
jgi:hypothetical protein